MTARRASGCAGGRKHLRNMPLLDRNGGQKFDTTPLANCFEQRILPRRMQTNTTILLTPSQKELTPLWLSLRMQLGGGFNFTDERFAVCTPAR
jgi:hypothetical protein